jgi:hypothetical protein
MTETEFREPLLIRTEGGPYPGTRTVYIGAEGDGGELIAWPLPELLWAHTGAYRKILESCLPPQEEGSHVVRGATYTWVEGEVIESAV